MSTLSKTGLFVVLVSLFVRANAAAQWNAARFGEGADVNRVYATFGVDPAFIGTLGLAHVVSLARHPLQLNAEGGIVVTKPGMRDFRARIGTQTSLMRWRSVGITGAAAFITRGTENSVYQGFDFGADLSAALGVYRPRWFAAGEYGKDKAIITHLTHSEWYRTNFYAGARDGWYLDAGGTYHYGVAGGITLGSMEMAARVGLLRTERFNTLAVPIYASIGLGFGF